MGDWIESLQNLANNLWNTISNTLDTAFYFPGIQTLTYVVSCTLAVLAPFIWFFKCVYTELLTTVTCLYNVTQKVWTYLSCCSVPLRPFIASVSEYTERIFKNVKEWVYIDNAPLFLRIIYWAIGVIGRIISTFFVALAKSLWHLLILTLFAILWAYFGYPYLMFAEEQPGRINDGISLWVDALEGVFNFFASVINAVADIYNPAAPIVWEYVIRLYEFVSLFINFLLAAVGLNPNFVIISSWSFENLVNDASALPAITQLGARRILQQQVTWGENANEAVSLLCIYMVSCVQFFQCQQCPCAFHRHENKVSYRIRKNTRLYDNFSLHF